MAGEESDVEGAMVAIAAMAAKKGGMQTDARVKERSERKGTEWRVCVRGRAVRREREREREQGRERREATKKGGSVCLGPNGKAGVE